MTSQEQTSTDETLRSLAQWGWTMVAYGDRTDPDCLVSYQRRGDHVDVLVMAGEDRCAGYRAPCWSDQDPIEVSSVVWHYLGDVATVLRWLITLPAVDPSWPQYPLPAQVPLPGKHTKRRTIRPPQ
jgi:hypothetical protein